MLQLVDQGRIDLHAPIGHYLPWFSIPSSYPPFTVHHLLSHTAGLVRGGGVGEQGLDSGRAFAQRIAIDRTIAAVRERLDEAVFAAAWADGRALPLEQAIAYALEEGDGAEP